MADAHFAAAMEDVLGVYARPRDPLRPQLNLDESSKQLIGEVRGPLRGPDGEKYDFEYKRNGTANLFMVCAPLEGWRHVEVTDRHTAVDFAEVLRKISDEFFPLAEKIVLVLDNLNTHNFASLYKAFEPAQARRIAERFELHYTPKHGSWLNIAEQEFSVLQRQCLNRRIPDREILEKEVAAWERNRNESKATVNWTFTSEKARTKMKHVYPVISEKK
jgi:hypothetical protein